MAYSLVPIVHIVAVVLSIIVLGLTAFDVSVFHGYFYNDGVYYDGDSSPSQLNFMLFNSIWSLLVLAYIGITPLYVAHLFHKLASLALESTTMLFWFAGSIAMAVWLGVPNCGGDTFCGTLQAAIAFGFFLWALFGFLVILDTIEALRSRRGHPATAHNKAAPYAGA